MMDRKFPRQDKPPAGAIGYRELDTLLDVVVQQLKPGPYLMGEQFTAADVVTGSGLRWGMAFGMIPQRKEIVDYVAWLRAWPSPTFFESAFVCQSCSYFVLFVESNYL